MATITKLSSSKLAKLETTAQIKLTSDEKTLINEQIGEALDAVKLLKTLDTKGVTPLAHPTGLKNVTRKDVVIPSLTQEEALSGAKRTHNGYFVVDAILEHK